MFVSTSLLKFHICKLYCIVMKNSFCDVTSKLEHFLHRNIKSTILRHMKIEHNNISYICNLCENNVI